MILLLLSTMLIAFCIVHWLYFRPQGGNITSDTPPPSQIAPPSIVPGAPILGSAVSLGREGADFLYNCKQKYGDAFTLNVVGQKMTFLFDPKAIVHFFKASETQLSFLPAVEQWTQRVFGLPPSDFIPRHKIILTKMRELVGTRASLPGHASRLLPLLHKAINDWIGTGKTKESAEEWKEIELSGAISQLVFEASVESLFGAKFLERHGKDTLREAFFTFESCFELAASPIPHIFQPTFRASRSVLLQALAASHAAGEFEDTVIGYLIQASEMPASSVPNMLLAVLWASQANTVPTAFWTVGFLLLPENKTYLDALRVSILAKDSNNDELDSINGGLLTDPQIGRLIEMACDPQSLLTKCCMEALRLRSSSTDVRIAATDVIVPCSTLANAQRHINNSVVDASNVLIKKGTMVMLCPWISHTDERLFEEPMRFNPNRLGADLPGGKLLHSPCAGVGGIAGVAFGGGRFRCPGRSFAEMELGVTVGRILAGLDVRLSEKEIEEEAEGEERAAWPGDPNRMLPGPDIKKLVGIKVPEGPCYVRIRRRAWH